MSEPVEKFRDMATKLLVDMRNTDFNKCREHAKQLDEMSYRVQRGESYVVVYAEFKRAIKK